MKRYLFTDTYYYSYEVEADTEKEARELAARVSVSSWNDLTFDETNLDYVEEEYE